MVRCLILGVLLLFCRPASGQYGQSLVCGYSSLTWNGTVLETLIVEDEWVRSAEFTNLTSIRSAGIYNNTRLTNLNLSALKAHVGGNNQYIYISGNPVLGAVDLSALVSSSSYISIIYNPALPSLQLPKLAFVSQGFSIVENASLTNVNLPALVSVASYPLLGFLASNCSSLADVSFPKYLPGNGRPQSFDGCALTQASVDHILARCVASQNYVSGTVKVNGGTSAPPSAAGLADVAILQARGVTVFHN